MEKFTLGQLVTALSGTLLGEVQDASIEISDVKTDNRKCTEGDVFFALIGEKNDAHRFVPGALENGALGAVVSKRPQELMPGKFYVLVKDTTLALGDLARWYRQQFNIPVVAVTGSVGKTTTKDMVASVLSAKFNTLRTPGNFNNHIGLPFTIFMMDHSTEAAVIEMGMNHPNEIDYLVNITHPDSAVITNVTDAHIGNLGSRENILKAKSEIFHGLKKGGLAVLNGDNDLLPTLKNTGILDDFEVVWYGENAGNDYRAIDIDDTQTDRVTCKLQTPQGTYPVVIPAPGRHMIYSAATAAAIGAHYGMTPEEIARGIASYEPTGGRMEAIECANGIRVYDGTYNASTASMKSSLAILSHCEGTRRVAVLGDMLEQGSYEEQLHREVGAYAATLPKVETILCIGKASRYIAKEAEKGHADVRWYADRDRAREDLRGLMKPGTVFLFKASHGMELGELVKFVRDNA